jgi:hypothetical protein
VLNTIESSLDGRALGLVTRYRAMARMLAGYNLKGQFGTWLAPVSAWGHARRQAACIRREAERREEDHRPFYA